MTDITHDAASAADDGFHEIQLSGKQLVFLFMTATLVLAAVFLLGVQVGRGVKTDRSPDIASTDALSTATVTPPVSTPPPTAAASGPPAAEPPAPAQDADDQLSYAKRLQGDSAAPEQLKPLSSPRSAAESKSARIAEPKTSATLPAPKPNAAPASNAAASNGQAGAWVVQLVALKDRGDAAAMAKRLSTKGYPAFVLDPSAGAPVIYRVQVGGYPDRDHADQAARRIEREEKIQGYVRSR